MNDKIVDAMSAQMKAVRKGRDREEKQLRRIQAEHAAMAERLAEIEEVFTDDKGRLRWNGSGEPVSRKV